MKKQASLKTLICLLLALTFLFPLQAFAENGVFTDPNFREWDTEYPNHWKFVTEDLESAYIIQTGDGFMVEVFESYAYLYQKIELEQQTAYRISFDVLTEGMENSGIGAQAAFMYQVASSDHVFDTAEDYQTVEFFVKTNVDLEQEYVFRLGVGVEGYQCTGSAYFRNLKIEALDVMPDDQIVYTLIGSIGIDAEEFDFIEQTVVEDEYISPAASEEEEVKVTYNSIGVALSGALAAVALFLLFIGRHSPKLGAILQKKSSMIVLFGLAFLIRVLFAITEEGHITDMNCFKAWASIVYTDGMDVFYTSGGFADYPPAYMMLLYIFGFIRDAFSLAYDSMVYELLILLPPMICDLALAYFVFSIAEKKMNRSTGIMLALFILFGPVFVIDGAVWGQIDSVLTLAIAVSLYFLTQGKKWQMAAVYTLAVLIKPQAALIAPIIIAVYLRDVFTKGKTKQALIDIGLSAVAVVVVYSVISLPFKGTQGYLYVFERMLDTVGQYPYATVNAFNLFGLAGGNFVNYDEIFVLLSYKDWGTIFIALVVIFAIYLTIREKDSTRGIWIGAAVTYIGIFFFGHGMHERYVFPSIVFFIMAAIEYDSKRLLGASAFLQSVSFANIFYVLIYRGTWIPEYCIEPIAIAYMLYITYAFIAALFAGTRERTIRIEDVELQRFAERAALEAKYRFEEFEPHDDRRMKKKDYLFMLLITAVYALVALTNLGGTNIPERTEVLTEGESYIIELDESRYIEKLEYYAGYAEADLVVYLSEDGVEYHSGTQTNMIDHEYNKMFAWQFYDIYEHAKYIKLYVSHGEMELREIGFWNEAAELLPIENAYVLGSSGAKREAPDLFDEQDEVDYVTDYMDEMIFDEVYHARTAYEYLEGIYPYEITHPPFGKSIMTLGIRLFGMNPFGWRFMGTLFGVMILPVMYVFAKRIFKKTKWACASTILFAADFMHYALTRIATIDSYSIFFILTMAYFMYEYMQHNFLKEKLSRTLLPLGLCGMFWALGCATKWLCIYAGVGLAIAFFYTVYQRSIELKVILSEDYVLENKEAIKKDFRKKLIWTLLFCVLMFIIVPLAVYCVSYLPYENTAENFGLHGIWKNQEYMLNYHGDVREEGHPFNSKVWTWPFDIRPVFFFMANNMDGEHTAGISCFGNPILWWSGVIAVLFLIGVGKKGKLDFKGMPYIALMALCQLVPWMIIRREVYIYHYFATVPFLVLAIVFALRYLEENFSWGKKAAWIYVGVVVLAFICFYPMITGIVVPRWYSDFFRWLETWPFYNV
ncbi:MAG: phospholipid carrier-dependent glycosyltransferase [Clostridiales bacterium]|nr:phospholipid carrier-dependent glycosyltransferase [Clostridiales bacterium]